MKYTEDLVARVFFDALSPKVKLLFEDILEEGMILTMVGGATRDFLLYGRVSKDIDLEIRMEIHLEEEEWKKTLFVLGQKLKTNYTVEFLPFGILRILVGDFVVEISSPRVEKYSDLGPWGHSDFIATLSPTFSYEDSFKRRDFTVNAIGFEFSDLIELRIQDPYKGIEDLKVGILRFCDEDFFKDPVRFLRMIRFNRKFNYRFAPSLEMNLSRFNLSKLRPYHFCAEGFKSGFTTFLNDFFSLIENEKISVSDDILLFKEFLKDDFKCDFCHSYLELFVAKIFQNEDICSLGNLKIIAEKLGIKITLLDQLSEFKKILNYFRLHPFEKIINEIKLLSTSEDWTIICDNDYLYHLERFHFYQRRLVSLYPLFDTCFSSDLKKTLNQFEKLFSSELSGRNEFAQVCQNSSISKDKISVLRIYIHLKEAIFSS